MSNKDNKLQLTEKHALEEDKKMMEIVKEFNEPGISIKDIFPSAEVMPNLLYAADGDLPRATLKLVLENGVDINQGFDLFGTLGYTALHCAAENGQFDTVKFLIEMGTDPSVTLKSSPFSTPADLAEKIFPEIATYLRQFQK